MRCIWYEVVAHRPFAEYFCPDVMYITEVRKDMRYTSACFILKGNSPNSSPEAVASGFCNPDAKPCGIKGSGKQFPEPTEFSPLNW